MSTRDTAFFKSGGARTAREQQEFLSKVIGSLGHSFCVIDPKDYRVLLANPASAVEHGAEGVKCYTLVRGRAEPCMGPDLPCPLEEVRRSGKITKVDHVFRKLDGSVAYHEVHVYPFLDEEGKVTRVIEYALNVTDREVAKTALKVAYHNLETKVEECPAEFSSVTRRLQDEISKRKRAEADLRKNQDLIQAILGAAQDCVFMKDRSLRYTLVNPCMEMLLRLPASQIHGRTDVDLYGEAVGRYLQALDSRAIGGEPIEAEHTRTVHGSRLTFLESRRPVWDDKGNIVGLCGISRDITDRGGVRADLITTELEYRSPAMESTLKQARLAAATDATILLTGESGAGKDYLARYIHSHSRRSAGPFQVVNCAAVSAELAESELFGHEAGAFTGAHRPKRGLVELAEGGTLLLNEFIELSLPLQAKLLTFLDTKSFIRVGGEQTITVDIRLIGATNGDLERAVQVGDFRADLFFRLNVLSIEVPPLRKRTEDFPALVQQMALEIGQDLGLSSVPELSPLIMEKLARYAWPGNLRELRNALERAFILMRGDPTKMNDPNAWNLDSPVHYPPLKGSAARSYNERVREMKCSLIEHALRRTGGNKAAAARLLGMTRDALNRQIKTLDLEVRVSDE